MEIGLDLFGSIPRARLRDPDTSKEAAEAIKAKAGTHVFAIVSSLRHAGPATIDELAKRLPFDSVECARRLADAERMGVEQPTGLSRCGLAGRRQRVWRASR